MQTVDTPSSELGNIKNSLDGLRKLSAISWNPLLFLVSFGLAFALFSYGSSLPLPLRARGDAAEYLNIAFHFQSFYDALHYIGARTPGFPLFDYLFFYFDGSNSVLTKVNHICLTLCLFHQLTSLWIVFVCGKYNYIKNSSIALGVLFILLAAYPAIVMHTTTPLSDVFGMDLLLLAFSLFAPIQENTKSQVFPRIFRGVFIGGLLGYAILVRPAYVTGVFGFLTTLMLFAGLKSRKIFIILIPAITVTAAILFPVVQDCTTQFGRFCIENPNTFDIFGSINAGLGGAQTIWNYLPTPFPVYPDAFLSDHFHDRCHVTSFIGSVHDTSNLFACFYQQPFNSLLFFVKKMIGLFNTFRLTPYTEHITPSWYLWVSRLFSSIAFVGFWIFLVDGCRSIIRLFSRRNTAISPLFAALWVFCMAQAAMHSILHVEERFAFPLVPICLMAIIFKIKNLCNTDTTSTTRWFWIVFSFMILTLYFGQVLLWDHQQVM